MVQKSRLGTAWVLVLAAWAGLGCEEGFQPVPIEQYEWPIVDGDRETGERAVVMIYNDAGAGCTASVIAPRVVLTAKHCIQGMSARNWHVLVGSSMYSTVDEYRVVEQRTTPGGGIENADIAILILDRDFEHGFKKWEFVPAPGFAVLSTITAIGYGQTRYNDSSSAGTKYRRDGRVVAIGPRADYGLGAREFITQGENTCQGDSGGPILFNDTVVGIVSRGEAGCTGYGIMTRVSGFRDLINQALIDTGACVPAGLETCNQTDDDCWEGWDDGLGATCGCADNGFPTPERCDGVDNDCNAAIDDLPACGCTGGAAPGTEICDGVDNDCNGQVDEVCNRLGEPCSAGTECVGGMCEEIDGTRVCTARCTAGVGVPCPDGGFCEASACGEGLCRPAAAAAGSAPRGASCTRNGDCASRFCAPAPSGGMFCTEGCRPGALDCFSGELCGALADGCGACYPGSSPGTGRGFGEACNDDADCLSGLCLTDGDPAGCADGCDYRYCVTACDGTGACPEGAHCREGLCVRGPVSGPGDSCLYDRDCAAGSCISLGGVARCVEACAPDGTCGGGFTCNTGVCWPQGVALGDPCNPLASDCEGGECASVGGAVMCVTPCDGAGDCPSGLICVPGDDGVSGWCVPGAFSGGGGGGGGSGCDCSVASAPTPAAWASPLLLLGLLALRRRRRR